MPVQFSELEDDEKLDYHIIMERCLSFSRVVSGLSEDKIFRLIAHRNFEVLEKINAVLEVQDFVRIVAIILERNEVATKRRILDMLNLRLVQKVGTTSYVTIQYHHPFNATTNIDYTVFYACV